MSPLAVPLTHTYTSTIQGVLGHAMTLWKLRQYERIHKRAIERFGTTDAHLARLSSLVADEALVLQVDGDAEADVYRLLMRDEQRTQYLLASFFQTLLAALHLSGVLNKAPLKELHDDEFWWLEHARSTDDVLDDGPRTWYEDAELDAEELEDRLLYEIVDALAPDVARTAWQARELIELAKDQVSDAEARVSA